MSENFEKALELHNKGFNCAQAVALPFCEELGIDPVTVSKGMEGFGAGMGGFELTCGALSGAIFVASIKTADGDLEHPSTKRDTYTVCKKICDAFCAACGSHLCPELKGLRGGPMLKSCKECIKVGVQLAEEAINN